MKEYQTAILEALVHNIRTPLNLILGYSQQLQKLDTPHKLSDYSSRIYQAGIQVEELLQGFWEALQLRNSTSEETSLNYWLKTELFLMNCNLAVKHRVIFSSEIPVQDIIAMVSPLSLSLWFESFVAAVLALIPEKPVQIGLSLLSPATLQINISNDSITGDDVIIVLDSVVKMLESPETKLLTADIRLDKTSAAERIAFCVALDLHERTN